MEASDGKLYNELCLTMDYDSGYMSHNTGSNLDSSFDNSCEVTNAKSIYLSEDALLEMPQMKAIVKENYEETRKLFYLSEESDVISDSESVSDESVEIPVQKPLIFYSDNDKNALNNITNVFDGNFQQKRLTLIFSKCDKENVYTVKRKFNSLTPEKEQTELLNFHSNQTDSFDSTTEDKNLSLHTSSNKIDSSNPDNSTVGDPNSTCSSPNANFNKTDPTTQNLTCTSFNSSLNETDPQNSELSSNFNKIDQSTRHSDFNFTCTSFNTSTSKTDPQISDLSSNSDKMDPSIRHSDFNLTCTSFNSSSSKIDSLNRDNSTATDSNLTCSSFNVKLDELHRINSRSLNSKRPAPSTSSSIMTPQKRFVNSINPDLSPDLFAEEEKLEEPKIIPPTKERYVTKTDYQLLSRINESLKGVLPPRSVTVVKLTLDDMLKGIRTNENLFWIKKESATNRSLIANGSKTSNYEWPEGLQARWHGLHYNRSKLSEQIESQCAKYCERYVGAETQSSCTVFEMTNESPLKRKQLSNRLSLKSPGRRLSHLAKRRITFSNLQSSSSFAGSRARQIMVDARKLELLKRKSPRKTPKKSPRLKTRTTPSSSAKKKLAVRFRKLTGEIETASKRALFQSPERENRGGLFSNCSIDSKKQSTKRALFASPTKKVSPLKYSPFKRSPFKRLQMLNLQRKRKRSESEEGVGGPSKVARNVADGNFSSSEDARSGIRMRSGESVSSGNNLELSANHKKKLQWAVYEALSTQNIKPDHRQFKIFASILARITKRLLPSYSTFIGKEVGTSERMLRIAKNHVFNVVKGRSVEEIVGEFMRNKLKKDKPPQGYVGIQVNDDAKKKSLSNGIDRIRKVINFGEDEER